MHVKTVAKQNGQMSWLIVITWRKKPMLCWIEMALKIDGIVWLMRWCDCKCKNVNANGPTHSTSVTCRKCETTIDCRTFNCGAIKNRTAKKQAAQPMFANLNGFEWMQRKHLDKEIEEENRSVCIYSLVKYAYVACIIYIHTETEREMNWNLNNKKEYTVRRAVSRCKSVE